MTPRRMILAAFLLVWVALFAASYFLSVRIEGPRNIDTGFRRLDVLARYQFLAFGVAVAAAVLGLLWRRGGKGMLLMGVTPLALTVLLVVGFYVAFAVFNDQIVPEAPQPPTKSTQPVDQG